MTKSQIAEKVVKDFTAATNNNSGVLPTPFSSVLEAPVSNCLYSLEDIQRFRENMDYFGAEYIQRRFNFGSTLTPGGCDHLFDDIRIFVESPDYANNKTGKYCLVMYTMPGFKEARRVVVGGAKKVSSWNHVASIFHNWVNEILMTLEHHLVA